MPTIDPRVDAYVEKQAAFARPILEHIRSTVHRACPDASETIKWGMPFFVYNGTLLANMAGFKAHAAFGFWQGKSVTGNAGEGAMGNFGRLTSVDDLPPDAELEALIVKAMALNAGAAKGGAAGPKRPLKHPKTPVEAPADLVAALAGNAAAQATFDGFSPSCRREYIEWVVEAKRPETRTRRLAQAVEWMADGKQRNWKYQQC